VVYNAPLQIGPANLLWAAPTGYLATMVGIPYDDLDRWRAVYPPEVFAQQLRKTADGFEEGAALLRRLAEEKGSGVEAGALREEAALTAAAALHYHAVANQSEFVLLRQRLEQADTESIQKTRQRLRELLEEELRLAKGLHELQTGDSRIGFEATNHYFYTPMDLVEKVVNCAYLLEEFQNR
jgi:hypothetical protein